MALTSAAMRRVDASFMHFPSVCRQNHIGFPKLLSHYAGATILSAAVTGIRHGLLFLPDRRYPVYSVIPGGSGVKGSSCGGSSHKRKIASSAAKTVTPAMATTVLANSLTEIPTLPGIQPTAKPPGCTSVRISEIAGVAGRLFARWLVLTISRHDTEVAGLGARRRHHEAIRRQAAAQ